MASFYLQGAWISLYKRWGITASLANEKKNRLVFSKEEDGKETGREGKVTLIEYLLCVMGFSGCFILVISLNLHEDILHR